MRAGLHRQTITYQQVGQLIKMPPAGLGGMLEPIQAYCVAQQLPPLTVLVVQKDTGLPGMGLSAGQAEQVASDQAKVFSTDWLAHGNPLAEGFEKALSA